MKINELRNAIRQIVKEEVRTVVAEEVSKAMGKVLVEMVKEIKSPSLNKEVVQEEAEPQIQGAVLKTNNPKLNSVLAETARNFKPLKKAAGGSLADLMDGGFDKVGQSESVGVTQPVDDGTNLGYLRSIISENTNPGTPSVLDRGADVPDVLKGVFKKDFRAVMRKIDEAKKTGGMGMINASQVLSG